MRNYGLVREFDPGEYTQSLRSHVGANRVAQNWAIDYVKAGLESGEFQSWTAISLNNEMNRVKDELFPWNRQNSKECFQSGVGRAAKALSNWKKNKKHFKFPHRRKKGQNDSCSYENSTAFTVEDKRVRIPKIGWVKLLEPLTVTEGMEVTKLIVREKAGRWFITFAIREKDWEAPAKKEVKTLVGIDLGLKSLAVVSDGEILENPRNFKQAEKKLARLNQNLARAKRGSCRRRKAKKKLAAHHLKIRNRRQDFLHKLTTRLVLENDALVLEDLNVAGMKKLFGKSVSDVALAEIRRQMEYKSEWYGTTLIIYPRFQRSTGVCSCGYTTPEKMDLRIRKWDCPECGTVNDRDFAAAKVLEDYGCRVLQLLAADTSVTGDLETGLGQVDEACEDLKSSRQTTLLTKVNRK